MTENEKTDLEIMIDQHGLNAVIVAMAAICADKADHIRSSYDDRTLAKQWDKRCTRLAHFAVDLLKP